MLSRATPRGAGLQKRIGDALTEGPASNEAIETRVAAVGRSQCPSRLWCSQLSSGEAGPCGCDARCQHSHLVGVDAAGGFGEQTDQCLAPADTGGRPGWLRRECGGEEARDEDEGEEGVAIAGAVGGAADRASERGERERGDELKARQCSVRAMSHTHNPTTKITYVLPTGIGCKVGKGECHHGDFTLG